MCGKVGRSLLSRPIDYMLFEDCHFSHDTAVINAMVTWYLLEVVKMCLLTRSH